mgnify:CR=1 FL=1
MVQTPSMAHPLLAKIHDPAAVIGMIGPGYVALPLAMEFVHADFRATSDDVSQRVMNVLMAGRSHITDILHQVVQEAIAAGLRVATVVASRIGEYDAISSAVPTPRSRTRDPDLTAVPAAASAATWPRRACDIRRGSD